MKNNPVKLAVRWLSVFTLVYVVTFVCVAAFKYGHDPVNWYYAGKIALDSLIYLWVGALVCAIIGGIVWVMLWAWSD